MRFSLRSLLLVMALGPILIWLAWKYEWISAGENRSYAAVDLYAKPVDADNPPDYVRWVHVAWFGYEEVGRLDPYRRPLRREVIVFTHHPYYHKRVLWEF